jgi:hypothetical protein
MWQGRVPDEPFFDYREFVDIVGSGGFSSPVGYLEMEVRWPSELQ